MRFDTGSILRVHAHTKRTHSIVISVFAIVILSVIGSMFAHGHHSMMGSDEDPTDGAQVATAVFGAVAVYGVS